MRTNLLQTDAHYTVRDMIRDNIDIGRNIADGDESVYTYPEALCNVDNPILNQFTFAIENEGVHETRLDFSGISECDDCRDVTASCECN